MLISFILGLGAGWGAPHGEAHVRRLMGQAFGIDASRIPPVELATVTLAAAVFLAAVIAWLIAHPSTVALSLGVLVGVLAPRLKARLKAARAPDYDA